MSAGLENGNSGNAKNSTTGETAPVVDSTTTSSLKSQSAALPSLLAYCDEQNVFVSPCISAQSFAGRGLGVYAVRAIEAGTKLVHVPVSALLTVRSVPEAFLSKAVRRKVSVHFALAAFLAFADEKLVAKYRPWMRTWPGWDEMVEGMPVFWSGDFRAASAGAGAGAGAGVGGRKVDEKMDGKEEQRNGGGGEENVVGGRAKKRRKTVTGGGGGGDDDDDVGRPPRFSRSLGIDHLWLTQPSSSSAQTTASTHLASQADKIRACVSMLDRHFPLLKIRDSASHESYLKFLHMWACVNTRCFYYLRPGQAAPEDSNEAMALCPFQDLFNHSDAKGCASMFDKRGFFIHADRDYKVGEELFLRYGRHGNDMLWMEYGFFLDRNKDDALKIDRAVLASCTEKQMGPLHEEGYLGEYSLKSDGVCFRTIVVSYIGVLDNDQWSRFIGGGLDPETNPVFALPKLKAKRRIVDWILAVRNEAEENLKVIWRIKDDDKLIESFIGNASLTDEQQASPDFQATLAKKRRDICIRRWKQIFDTCMSALGQIERDCPGSFVVEAKEGRRKHDLSQTSGRFLDSLGAA